MEFKPQNIKSKQMTYKSYQLAFIRKVTVWALALGILTAASAAMLFGHRVGSAKAASAIQNDQPSVGSGLPLVGSNSQKSAASNSKPGSLLFFPKYTSDSANPSNVNTIISLTNVNPRDAVTLRLFFVRDCQVQNMFLNLAANQTRTLLASSEDPGKTGYLVVTAVNSQGVPSQFNWLIGSASIVTGRTATGHEANYNAVAVAKRTGGGIPVQDGVTEAEIKFNDTDYDRLPQLVALDRINNQDPNAGEEPPVPADITNVTLISPLANLAGGSQALQVVAIAYDQSGRPYPQIVNTTCALDKPVTGIWTLPSLNSFITPDRAGWSSFAAAIDGVPVPLLGLTLSDGVTEKHRSARHMQALSRLDSFTMKMPIAIPPIAANDVATSNQTDATNGSLGASEMKPGSLLVFPRFASGIYGDSRLYITNTHPTQKARVRLFFTGMADSTAMNETIIVLFPNQTTELNPNDLAPNQKGWVMATAIDNRYLPLNFNFLIGSARVKDQSGNAFGYTALGVAKNSAGSLPRNEDLQTATITFDGENYDRLFSTMAVAGLPSQVDNTTFFGYARPPASILDPVNIRGSVQTTVFDELLDQNSATIGGIEVRMGQVRGNITGPPVTSTILKGHRGWMRLAPGSPIFAWTNGAPTTPFAAQPDSSNWTGGIGGGVTLHALTLTESFQLKTLSTNPNNHAPTANFESIDYNTEARSQAGTIVRLDGRISTDPDVDDPLTYKWYDGETLISSASISDFRLGIGTHSLKLIVTDGNALSSEPLIRQVDVRDNTPPVISGVPTKITRTTGSSVGVTVNYPLPVAYDAVDGVVSVTSSKLPGYLFPAGITTVIFTARDNAGNTSTATMDVEIKKGTATFPQSGGVAGNKLPAMNSLNDQYVIIGKPRTISLEASDFDGDPIIFSLTGAPSYARLDGMDPVARKAKLVIAPQQGDQSAATNVRIVMTDAKGGIYQTLPFRIQISDVENDDTGSGKGPGGGGDGPPPPPPPGDGGTNNAPIARMNQLPATIQATLKEGAVVHLDGSQSSDADLDPLTYVWKDGETKVAEGAIVDATLPVGTHSITLTVSDGRGGTSSTTAQQIEVLPRPLTILSATPAKLPRFNTTTITVTGTGFNANTQVRFDCTSSCSGGSQISVTISSIEEDKIVLSAKTTQNTPLGNRDAVVVNTTGSNAGSAKLSRSNYVSN